MNPRSLRLAASLQVGAGRVRMREGGYGLGWHLQRAQGLARLLELEHAGVEDCVVRTEARWQTWPRRS